MLGGPNLNCSGGFWGGILSVFGGILALTQEIQKYRFKNGIKKALPSVSIRIISKSTIYLLIQLYIQNSLLSYRTKPNIIMQQIFKVQN